MVCTFLSFSQILRKRTHWRSACYHKVFCMTLPLVTASLSLSLEGWVTSHLGLVADTAQLRCQMTPQPQPVARVHVAEDGPTTPPRLNFPVMLQPMGARLHRARGHAQALGDLPDF